MKNTTTTTTKKADLYQEVTNAIIEKMRSGNLIWKRGCNGFLATNWITKTTYSGINYVLLNFMYPHDTCPYYATFKQVVKNGGKVKKGSKGRRIIFYKTLYKENGKYVSDNRVKNMSEAEKQGLERFHKLKKYYVFNMMDTEGIENFDYEKWGREPQPEILADEEILKKYENVLKLYRDKPEISVGHENAYYPTLDKIKHVRLVGWERAHDFVSTMFHELVHSTGHASRLGRFEASKFPRFGSPDYAKEELVAEIGAAMLCNHLGIFSDTVENNAAYLQGWLKVLENDERLIFKASAKAQRAVNYILNV